MLQPIEEGVRVRSRSGVPVRVRTIRKGGLLFALAGLPGCAAIWGFDDLRQGDGGFDASIQDSPSADDSTIGEAGTDDDRSVVDAEDLDSADGRAEGGGGDAGPTDAELHSDAAEAGPSVCSTICPGAQCCNDTGKCVPATTTTVCGVAGSACTDCTAHSSCNALALGPCCKSSGVCGCLGVAGCN